MNYQSAVVQLPLVKEPTSTVIKTPNCVSLFCKDLEKLAQESFHVLTLSVRNHLINRHMASLGLVNASLIHAREVFRPAIQDGAYGVILVHNHPSGDPTPSAEDIRITKQMVEVGKIVDIKVMDHIIIGRIIDILSTDSKSSFISLREQGICSF